MFILLKGGGLVDEYGNAVSIRGSGYVVQSQTEDRVIPIKPRGGKPYRYGDVAAKMAAIERERSTRDPDAMEEDELYTDTDQGQGASTDGPDGDAGTGQAQAASTIQPSQTANSGPSDRPTQDASSGSGDDDAVGPRDLSEMSDRDIFKELDRLPLQVYSGPAA